MFTLPFSALLCLAVFLSAILSGVLGMAGGMVLMGVFAWLLPVAQAMILHSTAQFFSNGSRAFFHRAHIYLPGLKFYALGLLTSLCIFSLVAVVPNKRLLFTILGVMPFLQFLLQKRVRFDFTAPAQAYACGVVVTAIHLTGGVSGALLDVFFQKVPLTRHQVISTKAATQTLSHVMRFFYFTFVVGAVTQGDWLQGLPPWLLLAVIPAAMAGTAVSRLLLERLSDAHFFKATQAALLAIGCIYLVKAASLWLGY